MTVAELFVKCLENEGVQYIFGVPGEENEDLLFAIDKSKKLKFIPCRHEQGAAFIANVWGRLTGNAGVCLATLGPGATNLVTGVADANLDKAPLVAITGQGGLERLHHESHQNIDVVKMMNPITKWNTSIHHPQTTAEVIRKAFKIAEYEKPGATHIELPEDIAHQKVKGKKPLRKVVAQLPAPDQAAIKKTIQLLKKSKQPLIIAGNGTIRDRSSQELTKLAKRFNIPVAATFMGKGAVSDKEKQSLLSMGLGFKDYVIEAVEQADLILTIGYDIAEYSPEQWNPSNNKKIVHIDFEPAEVYERYLPEIEIISDIAPAICAIYDELEEVGADSFSDWYLPIRKRILKDIESYQPKKSETLNVPIALNLIRDALSDDGILLSDVGSHKMWIARNFVTYEPNTCIISNGLASMGISLPGAIAASMAYPDRQVVSIAGDGGFMMNLQEIETAKRLGLNFTMIVFNDNDYGLISWKQERATGKTTGTNLTNPDFVKLAKSFGIDGHRANNATQLKSILKKSIASDKLTLIEVPITTKVNQALIKKLNRYWEKK